MKELTALQKLDKVLDILSGTEGKNKIGLKAYLSNPIGIEWTENYIKRLIKHLEEDKYIEDDKGIYRLTFRGEIFQKDGGYVANAIKSQTLLELQDAEKDRIEAQSAALLELNQQAVTHSKHLNRLTFYIAVGTIVASVIAVLLLVLQWYFDLHPIAPK